MIHLRLNRYAPSIGAVLFLVFGAFLTLSSVARPPTPKALANSPDNTGMLIHAALAIAPIEPTSTPTVPPAATDIPPTPAPAPVPLPPLKAILLHPISQKDRAQYRSDAEYNDNKDSACSLTAATMVLNAYGKKTKVSDLLAWMSSHNASVTDGLTMKTFPVFGSALPAAFGLHGTARTESNLDKHFALLSDALHKGYPVMTDIYDPTYFPDGHWIVLTEVIAHKDLAKRAPSLPHSDQAGIVDFTKSEWNAGAVLVLNPDPSSRNHLPVTQVWPLSRFKQFFGAVHLSVVYTP